MLQTAIQLGPRAHYCYFPGKSEQPTYAFNKIVWPNVQARSHGVQGVKCIPSQICQKVHFQPQNGSKMGFFYVGLKGVRFKKCTFLGPKGPLLGVPHPSKLILATDLQMLICKTLQIVLLNLGVFKFSFGRDVPLWILKVDPYITKFPRKSDCFGVKFLIKITDFFWNFLPALLSILYLLSKFGMCTISKACFKWGYFDFKLEIILVQNFI